MNMQNSADRHFRDGNDGRRRAPFFVFATTYASNLISDGGFSMKKPFLIVAAVGFAVAVGTVAVVSMQPQHTADSTAAGCPSGVPWLLLLSTEKGRPCVRWRG
jgi:hypothetical protein